jgi:hypothetical protein
MLTRDGVIAFTFCDPGFDRSLCDPRLPPGTGVIEMAGPQQERSPNWCVVVDHKLYVEPGDELCQQERQGKAEDSYCSYFTAGYMASLFPDATVRPPVCPEWQHCCILRGTE